MAKKLATSNLPFQAFEGFIRTENKNNFSNFYFLFFSAAFFRSIMKLSLIKLSENVPGSAKSMIKVSQSTKRGFSKKDLTGFEKLFLFWVRMNLSNAWKGKLEVASFFAI